MPTNIKDFVAGVQAPLEPEDKPTPRLAEALQKVLDRYRSAERLLLDEYYPLGTILYMISTVFYEPLGEFLERGTPGKVVSRWSWNAGTEHSIHIEIVSPSGIIHRITEDLPNIQHGWSLDPPATIADRLTDPLL